jgi:hypothetical protein
VPHLALHLVLPLVPHLVLQELPLALSVLPLVLLVLPPVLP